MQLTCYVTQCLHVIARQGYMPSDHDILMKNLFKHLINKFFPLIYELWSDTNVSEKLLKIGKSNYLLSQGQKFW